MDLSNVEMQSVSDKQIQSLLQQASSQGMSVDQAIVIAKSKGATQSQIDQLMRRINASKKTSAGGAANGQKETYSEVLYDYAQRYSQKADVVLSDKLQRIFGHQLFNTKELSFEPPVNLPIPTDYVLGVNDEIEITVSGASQQNYRLKVDRTGSISIPNIGPMSVQGMSFEEARRQIKRRLLSIFHGMAGASPNTWAEVSLSNLRSIRVNVLGEALSPGTYTLPSTASAFNALYLSGGPNENGSFRKIRIVRDNKVYKEIDIYDYLLNSDASSNITLRDEDVVYIPTYEVRVAAEGSFKRPGLYEMKEGESLADLFRYAGGYSPEAFKESVNISRINGNQKSLVDVPNRLFPTFKMEAGDSVTAGLVLNRYENRVKIDGAVFRPGSYSLTPGMKLSQLIDQAKGLREDAFVNRGVIIRLGKDLTPENIAFDLMEMKNGSNDPELQREDSVFIQDISTMRERRFVRIHGEVQKPGEYEFNEHMTIRDLLLVSGGLKEAASESMLEISRRHDYEGAAQKRSDMVTLYQLSVPRDLKLKSSDQKFELMPYDYIYVRKAPSYFEQKTVSIEGEVLYPGPYSIRSKNERVSDLLKRCGGLSANAYVQGATLYRSTGDVSQDTSVLANLGVDSLANRASHQLQNGRVELRLDKILKSPKSRYNYLLKEGDRISIPEISEEVRVAGAILNPVGLAYESNRSALHYIERAGGFADNANPGRVFVIYSDGTTKITKTFLTRKYPVVLPGSKIIVPRKQIRPRTEVGTWLGIASTLSSLALAIAAIAKM
jgi:protein involved in polysaccharide export with SLBB domain